MIVLLSLKDEHFHFKTVRRSWENNNYENIFLFKGKLRYKWKFFSLSKRILNHLANHSLKVHLSFSPYVVLPKESLLLASRL